MESTKQISKPMTIGDAAVEGLIYGIVAGLAMALFITLIEFWSGVAPTTALGYFDAGGNRSPIIGLFTHLAVSGIYGVVFGIVTMGVARMFGARMNLGVWLALGILYGALLFGIAEWIVLPRTNSPLMDMPTWGLAVAHFIFGALLAGLCGRRR